MENFEPVNFASDVPLNFRTILQLVMGLILIRDWHLVRKFTSHLMRASVIRLHRGYSSLDPKPAEQPDAPSIRSNQSLFLDGISITNNALSISENVLLNLSLRKLAEQLHRTGLKDLSLTQKMLSLLGMKAVQDVSEFESFINLFSLGILDAKGQDLTSILTQWNQRNKNIREMHRILTELDKSNSALLANSLSIEFIKYVVNGLCFIRQPLEAMNLLETYIHSATIAKGQSNNCTDSISDQQTNAVTAPGPANQEMSMIMALPSVQEMCKLILVSFIMQELYTMVDIFWVKVNSWYANVGIPVKIATKFAKFYAERPSLTSTKIKLDYLYDMWLKYNDLYDAKFYGELCYGYALSKSFYLVERLIWDCSYLEINNRALGLLLQHKLDSVGLDGTLNFISKLFPRLKSKGIVVGSFPFLIVAKSIGKSVNPEAMHKFVHLLESEGNLLVDDALITAIYNGIKSTHVFTNLHQRKECIELIRKICQENGLKIIVG